MNLKCLNLHGFIPFFSFHFDHSGTKHSHTRYMYFIRSCMTTEEHWFTFSRCSSISTFRSSMIYVWKIIKRMADTKICLAVKTIEISGSPVQRKRFRNSLFPILRFNKISHLLFNGFHQFNQWSLNCFAFHFHAKVETSDHWIRCDQWSQWIQSGTIWLEIRFNFVNFEWFNNLIGLNDEWIGFSCCSKMLTFRWLVGFYGSSWTINDFIRIRKQCTV